MKRLFALLLAGSASSAYAAQAPLFDAPSITCAENSVNCSLIITKSAVSKSYSKITVRTVDGTAKAGVDYLPVDKTITVSNNTLRTLVYIPVLDNATYQGSRSFTVNIIPLRNAQVAASMSPTTVTINDDEVQPPPPEPPVTGLSGEKPIPDNFNTASGIEQTWYGPTGRGGIAPASADPVGAQRMFCHPGQLNYDDPLVYPGLKGGSSHLHQFFGNDGARYDSNYQSLRTTGGTGCGLSTAPINRSAYWMPAMLDGVGGVVKPDYMNLYYKRDPASDPANGMPDATHVGIMTDLPNGLRFVFGYNMKTGTDGPLDLNSQMHDAIQFQCWASQDGTVSNNGINGYYHSIKEVVDAGCPVGARLMIIAAAPNCWDGKTIDSPDHRSHMSVSNGPMLPGQMFRSCPLDHPYAVPNVEVQVAFTTDANFVAGKWHLSSDEMIPGTIPGATWHMDYWEAWSPSVKATWHATCINQKLSCAGGDLGNGTQISGASLYPDSAFPRGVHVPIPARP